MPLGSSWASHQRHQGGKPGTGASLSSSRVQPPSKGGLKATHLGVSRPERAATYLRIKVPRLALSPEGEANFGLLITACFLTGPSSTLETEQVRQPCKSTEGEDSLLHPSGGEDSGCHPGYGDKGIPRLPVFIGEMLGGRGKLGSL